MSVNDQPVGATSPEGAHPVDGEPIPGATPSRFLPLLLAMAMFVLVVDTTIMNVSISAVAESLDATVSSVQSAIALEALVSAAFILINSKLGDLMGRKRAYVIGLVAYAVGALAMTLAQSVTAIVVFWAVIGGLGASLLLPAMQSLIHGNFDGAARAKVYALVGASMAIAAAIGPLIGGVITTFWSWRINFALEFVIIVVVLSGIRLVKDVPYTGDRIVDGVGAVLSVVGMGGVVLGILVWQEGGEAVLALLAVGAVGLFATRSLAGPAQARRQGRSCSTRPVRPAALPDRDHAADAAADRPRRRDDRHPDLPADRAGVQRARGRPGDRAAVAEHVRGRDGSRASGPASVVRP